MGVEYLSSFFGQNNEFSFVTNTLKSKLLVIQDLNLKKKNTSQQTLSE